jgi:hypothetical protein
VRAIAGAAAVAAAEAVASPAQECISRNRCHHLLKTLWTGVYGWHDKQLPDGTVIWTSPSGHTYRTVPGSKLLVPDLCVPTAELELSSSRPREYGDRGAMMPRRKRTRANDRRARIMAERYANQRSSARLITTR